MIDQKHIITSVFFAMSLLTCAASAKTPKVVIQTTGDCQNYAIAAKDVIDQIKDVPEFRLVVACSDTTWEYLRNKADAAKTNTAFTNIPARLTVLRGSVAENPIELKRVISHEIEHLRCKCSLGEP